MTASGGIATFTDLSDRRARDHHACISPARRSLTSATSNSIVVIAPATQLAIHTQPSSTATAGVAFSTQPVVYVEDQYGNLETGDNTTQVTASLASGTGPLLGTVTVTVSGGIATFTDLSDNTAETISLAVHQRPGPDRRNFQQHRDQPGGGEPVGDRTRSLHRRRPRASPSARSRWSTSKTSTATWRPATTRRRSPPRSPPGAGPAARHHDGDSLRRHRHVHRSGGRHGRDDLAPVHQRSRL